LRQGGPVGWMAHLGGFAIGMLTVNFFLPVNPVAKPQKPKARKRRGGKVKKR